MSERFYINLPLQPGPVILDGPEAHHLAAVCRLGPGDAVCLFNGDGCEYPGHVVAVQKRHVEVEVKEVLSPQRELPFRLEVTAPLPKGDRGQFLVEKLTELGVARYVPLSTQRSVVHPREGRLEKLERYVIEASKQCGRNVLMAIGELTEWRTYCRDGNVHGLKILAHPSAESSTSLATLRITEPVYAAVGPEGGFADTEVEDAVASGWTLVDLGPRILRVETAALALASCLALCH
jgi:16S rRNA (uracil1498-N3)-methyltransferase